MKTFTILLAALLVSQGYAALIYIQPKATCAVMGSYINNFNSMKFDACVIDRSDQAQCTLTCTSNDAQAPIPRLKVAVLPGCDFLGNGIQISVESSASQTLYSDKFYSNRTVSPPFLTQGAFVVTIVQVSPVHVGFQLQLMEQSSVTDTSQTTQLLPYQVIPTDSTYFNCPIKNSSNDQTCPSLDGVTSAGPYPMLGNCQKNALCSSLQCGLDSGTIADIKFSSFTFFPCSIPPTVNIVVAGSQGVEISENLTISKNISFMTMDGTLNARVEHPNESFVGFGVDIARSDGTISTGLPYRLIPLSISICQPPTAPPTQPPVADDIRLTGGESYLSGRVEIKINNTWGTICDYNNRFQYSSNAANFICMQLQLGEGQVLRSGQVTSFNYPNPDNLPIFWSNFSCPVYFKSKRIQNECTFKSPPLVNCTEAMNIAIQCSNCSGYICDEGTCAKPCDGVKECNNGADESGIVCFFTKGLSTNAQIAIGVVFGFIFLAIVAIGIAIGVCACTGVIGSSSGPRSKPSSVTATSYKPGPSRLQTV